jgi:two-component system, sensor histidine kinase and response regulator
MESAMERPTVLIVDDSPFDLDVQAEALRGSHRVLCAPDPDAAFELIHSGARPDLIVLDITMPGGGGLQVCRRLRADRETASVPVIFVTAQDGADSEEAGFAAGGVDYVTKPINPHLLLARVRTHIELERAREELERQNEELKEVARLREEVEQINRHDLKNPLMVILNVPPLLAHQENITSDQRKWLQMIEEAARRMLEMINRSVDLLKMERGIYPLNAVNVDLLPVVRKVVASVGPLAEAARVSVALDVDGRPAGSADTFPVHGEELLLYSMFANLVKNAVEAAPTQSTVTLSFRAAATALISVHNRGAVPAAVRGRFFEKFATAGKTGGTGLGAYSARLVATTLGGTISCVSCEEEGTTITVDLPRGTP